MTSNVISDAAQANQAGMAALAQGDAAGAVRYFAMATAADPMAGALHRNLASAHRALGDDAAEIAALDAALAIDQTDFAALLRKAQLLQRRKEDDKALLCWSGVLQIASGFSEVPDGLRQILDDGRAYVADRQSRISAAIDAALTGPLQSMDATARRRARAFANLATGQGRVYHNECAGLYYPFLPADEFFDDVHFPWFAELSAAAPAIRAELEALLAGGDAALRPYVQLEKGTPDSKWTALDHKLDWGACFLWEYGVPNTPVIERCPATAAAISALPSAHIPARAPNVFFSLLRPKTRIPPHTGVTNSRAIIHLPLIVPAGCGFRVGNETREWVEGRPFAFDDTIEHEAWNDSDALRAVLIFDVWNPHLSVQEQDIIARYYAAADAAGLNR